MARIIKLTEELRWTNLREAFPIGMRTVEVLERDAKGNLVLHNGEPKVIKVQKRVNELETAIADGTLDKMVAVCADTYHNGDVQGVYAAMAKTLDSMRCNLKNGNKNTSLWKNDTERLGILTAYVRSHRTAQSRSTDGLPQWAFGPTEIDQITDPARLQKIINSISDVCADKAGASYVGLLGEDYVTKAKANREYARKRKAALEAKTQAPDPELIAKLNKPGKTGKVTLTPEEVETLMKLLGR